MQTAILAGGKGTRMLPETSIRPKALIQVAGRPFIDHQLRLLRDRGVDEVVLCVGNLGDQIEAFVGDGSRWDIDVAYSWDGATLLGTAGALRVAAAAGLLRQEFLILYGDSYLPIDFAPVLATFFRCGLPALMTVLHNEGRWDQSNARYEDGRVVKYDKSRTGGALDWIDYGLSVLTRDVIVERVPPDVPLDLAEVFHDLSVEGRLAGHPVQERFYEVGSPEGRAELDRYLAGL